MKNKFIALAVAILAILFIYFFRREKTDSIETTNFSIHYTAGIDGKYLSHLTTYLESFYSNVSNELKVDENEKINLHLHCSRWSYIKRTYNYKAPSTIKSLSEIHFLSQRNDSGSNKLILNRVTEVILTRFLARDLKSRLLSNSNLTHRDFEPWVWEAIILYEEKDFKDPKSIKFLRDKAPQTYDMANVAEGSLIYDCGFTLIEYIIAAYGRQKYIELIKGFGDVNKILAVSEKKLIDDWYEYVKAKYLLDKSLMPDR